MEDIQKEQKSSLMLFYSGYGGYNPTNATTRTTLECTYSKLLATSCEDTDFFCCHWYQSTFSLVILDEVGTHNIWRLADAKSTKKTALRVIERTNTVPKKISQTLFYFSCNGAIRSCGAMRYFLKGLVTRYVQSSFVSRMVNSPYMDQSYDK